MSNLNSAAASVAKALSTVPAVNQAKLAELAKQARLVDPEVARFIARSALKSQAVRKQQPYYSVIRFPFAVATLANGDVQYTLSRKKLIAFSYGVQDAMTAAGFPDTMSASESETNIVTKNDTGGKIVEIDGLSLHLDELADARLAKYLWSKTVVDITLDGSKRHVLLGRMGQLTSGGGLYGTGESFIAPPPMTASTSQIGALTNGVPHRGNYYKLTERLRWNPAGTDSKFQVRFEVTSDIVLTATPRPGLAGVAPFTPPTKAGEVGTYVDVVVYLHTHEIAARSKQG